MRRSKRDLWRLVEDADTTDGVDIPVFGYRDDGTLVDDQGTPIEAAVFVVRREEPSGAPE